MDQIFKALNDPTRRALLDALRAQDGQTLTELEARLEMTRFGVMRHLKVLEEAELVVVRRAGRFKHHHLNALPLQEVVDRWVEPFLVKPLVRSMIDLKARLEAETDMTASDIADDLAPSFVAQTFIRTTQDALWAALTEPDLIAAHHFAASRAEALPDGGRVMRLADGAPMLTERRIKAEPKSRLEVTFEPHWFGPDAPASRVVFLIEVEGATCKLTCEHYALPAAQEGVKEGWARYLASLKSYLETGAPIKLTG